MPVQTGERVAQVIAREARPGADWEVASNPEFLREGSAVVDTLDPDRVVVGTNSERGLAALRELYQPILERSGAPFLATDRATAELIKHASNAFLATKISFINSVARVCERSGADVELVAQGHGPGPAHRRPLPQGRGRLRGQLLPQGRGRLRPPLRASWGSTSASSTRWPRSTTRPGGPWSTRSATPSGTWTASGSGCSGLSFKPNTDDLREAPSIDVARDLLADGAQVVAYDPVAGDQAADRCPAWSWPTRRSRSPTAPTPWS